jgi:hypothetical protein
MVDYFNSKFKLINYLIINTLKLIFVKAMRGINQTSLSQN